eukprot:4720134-Amphidinium_carterae.1
MQFWGLAWMGAGLVFIRSLLAVLSGSPTGCWEFINIHIILPQLVRKEGLLWHGLGTLEHNQTDFVEFWSALVPLETILQQMFPGDRHAAWDIEQKYAWDRVSLYMETYLYVTEETEQASQRLETDGENYKDGSEILPPTRMANRLEWSWE